MFEEACDYGSPEEVCSYMDKTADAIVLTDREGRIIRVNEPWEDLCGYSFDEVVGKTSAVLQGARTDPTVSRDISRRVKDDYAVRRVVTNYKKSGIEFRNDLMILPLRRARGSRAAFVARLQDLSSKFKVY